MKTTDRTQEQDDRSMKKLLTVGLLAVAAFIHGGAPIVHSQREYEGINRL